MNEVIKKYLAEIVGSVVCLVLGMVSGYVSGSGVSSWFATLAKPSFSPPWWLFGPVWTVLYVMMGVALGKIWRSKAASLLGWFVLQFAFNLMWSPLFFWLHRVDLALYDLSLLWLSLVIFMGLAWRHRTVFWLMVPYLLWVSFAFLLNFSIFKLMP